MVVAEEATATTIIEIGTTTEVVVDMIVRPTKTMAVETVKTNTSVIAEEDAPRATTKKVNMISITSIESIQLTTPSIVSDSLALKMIPVTKSEEQRLRWTRGWKRLYM